MPLNERRETMQKVLSLVRLFVSESDFALGYRGLVLKKEVSRSRNGMYSHKMYKYGGEGV